MADIRTHYLDASAAVKLFVCEDDCSLIVRDYFNKHSVFFITSICFAETLGVLKLKALRGLITQEEYLAACEELTAHVRGKRIQIEDVGISNRQIFDQVECFVKKYTLDVADAYQLVTLKRGLCANLKAESQTILITADEKLASAAKFENLRVWDCLREGAP